MAMHISQIIEDINKSGILFEVWNGRYMSRATVGAYRLGLDEYSAEFIDYLKNNARHTKISRLEDLPRVVAAHYNLFKISLHNEFDQLDEYL